MSNILKVTTPVLGYDNANNVKTGPVKTTDPSINAPILPDKVTKPDARSDSASSEQNVAMKFKYQSNYDNFISQMLKLSGMTEHFSKLFFERFATIVQSGLGEEFAEQIGSFFEMVGVEQFELVDFLKKQTSASVRFTGAFFEVLNNVLKQTTSVELKTSILDFLRRYVDMAENNHLMQNMQNALDEISKNLVKSSAGELAKLVDKLITTMPASDAIITQNTSILKDEILPFINKYISKFNDRGEIRKFTAILSAYVARYQNGKQERVTGAFEQLMKFTAMQKSFGDLNPETLLMVLSKTEYEKGVKTQQWMDNFVELVEKGVSGQAGSENKAVFKNLMQSILLNESVYMPVLHLMLPLAIDGKLMFAEMWIDPDADKNKQNSEGGNEKTVSGLIKFDVQEVGFFDLFFMYTDNKIRLQMTCPTKLEEDLDGIHKAISQILVDNGIAIEELFVETGTPSIPISSAFPRIFERKNSVNVSI